MDLGTRAIATFDALAEYCRRVASAVGLICLEIFGYRDPRTRAYAVSLGHGAAADQHHSRRRRRSGARPRLPAAEDLERFGVTEDDLRRGRVTPAVAALLQFECERARDYYRRAAAAAAGRRCRAAWWPPRSWAASTSGSCGASSARGYDVFSRRIRVPRPHARDRAAHLARLLDALSCTCALPVR